jgi:Domain of unknown function (DUF6048)
VSPATSRYIFSIVLLSLSWPLAAQDRLPNDSSKYKFLPTGIRVGTDLLAIGKSIATDYYQGWEVNFDADVYRRYYVAVDYGKSSSNFLLGNGVYSNTGSYYRIGVDVNFLLKDPDRNMFFIGIRHGHASYTDFSEYTYTDKFFGNGTVTRTNINPSANWKELTTGLRVKVWKFIWLGATARMKFRMRGKDQWDLVSYEVPGYGKTIKNNWWGINYQIFIRIPTR